MQIEEYQIYRYVWGDFTSFEGGKSTLEKLPEHLTCKQVITNNIASSVVDSPSSVRLTKPDLTKLANKYPLFNRQISLSTDQLKLTKLSIAQLDEIVRILVENPTLKLRLLPTALPQNATKEIVRTPTRVIRNYLLAQNIPAYRIKTLSNPAAVIVPHSGQEVRLLLVDLKEELVLDRFGPDGNFVEEKSATFTKNFME
ncbi:MAG: hypothetical protein AAF960_14940 [Bacteroidota bacterium]